MNSPYGVCGPEMEADSIAIAQASVAIFDHYETLVGSNIVAANERQHDEYDNLYLVPN
jgi:hypothetical protein